MPGQEFAGLFSMMFKRVFNRFAVDSIADYIDCTFV
jgi:hypothetical protein